MHSYSSHPQIYICHYHLRFLLSAVILKLLTLLQHSL